MWTLPTYLHPAREASILLTVIPALRRNPIPDE